MVGLQKIVRANVHSHIGGTTELRPFVPLDHPMPQFAQSRGNQAPDQRALRTSLRACVQGHGQRGTRDAIVRGGPLGGRQPDRGEDVFPARLARFPLEDQSPNARSRFDDQSLRSPASKIGAPCAGPARPAP